MTKYKDQYRIESSRLVVWDYSCPWWYFVTINTKNHIHHFGKIKNGKMKLNELGIVAEQEWLKTKTLRTNIDLDYFVVMPNHMHGIIILNPVETRCPVETRHNVETCRGKSLQEEDTAAFGKPIKNSLSVIINQFKGSVKRWANKNDHRDFFWQPRFYDRIIRNEKELYRIRKYIELNPLKWEIEKEIPENLEL